MNRRCREGVPGLRCCFGDPGVYRGVRMEAEAVMEREQEIQAALDHPLEDRPWRQYCRYLLSLLDAERALRAKAEQERDRWKEDASVLLDVSEELVKTEAELAEAREALLKVMGATTPGEPAWDIASAALSVGEPE